MNAISNQLTKVKIQKIVEKVAPVWDLDSYIAVNPFLGYAEKGFDQALRYWEGVLETSLLPTPEILDQKPTQPSDKSLLESEYSMLNMVLGGFLGSYIDKEISYWKSPWKELSLWEGFLEWVDYDPIWRKAESLSKKKFSNRPNLKKKNLSPNPVQAILEMSGLDPQVNSDWLEEWSIRFQGWAGYFRRDVWLKEMKDDCDAIGLLAILVYTKLRLPILFQYDLGQDSLRDRELSRLQREKSFQERKRYLVLAENRYQSELFQKLRESAAQSQKKRGVEKYGSDGSDLIAKPRVRFLFCIDVRSESIRRHLENQSERIETDGFAGFFGMPISWDYWTEQNLSHSPALIQPPIQLGSALNISKAKPSRTVLKTKAWIQKIKRTFPIGFQYVEGAGFLSALGMISKTLKKSIGVSDIRAVSESDLDAAIQSLSLDTKVALAKGLLNHLGWNENFPEVVIIVGHTSHTTNNPHEAGLACGACSGQSGELSARIASKILNDRFVRSILGNNENQLLVPERTIFLPAVHETVSDRILVGESEDLNPELGKEIHEWVRIAQLENEKEKERLLGLEAGRGLARTKDWAEVFPEAGLAGCASFIIASRVHTRGLDLGGKSFLNTYDWRKDTEDQTLDLLLSAPAVVGSWINLQYYASTVAPASLGAGNKLLHSPLGNRGVWEGNHWNLRAGLPLQSVYNGERFLHDCLRLSILVEAPKEKIDRILDKQDTFRNLVFGQWVYLVSWDPENNEFWTRSSEGWSKVAV